ncbi:MAG: (d)CMP kinase [Hyphomicrobiaceae bacterium]
MIIAIDGPAASGKGTLARRIAKHFGYRYLDTGALYRGVARDCLKRGFRPSDRWAVVAMARSLDPATLDDAGLRDQGVGDAASIVAQLPEVRAALLDYQRRFAKQPPGAVLDGRDIGTTICPHADIKIFVQATPEVRANRRFLELKASGADVDEAGVLELIRLRDARDAGRENAPMRVADDAHLLDTSDLDIETAFAAALGIITRLSGQSAS